MPQLPSVSTIGRGMDASRTSGPGHRLPGARGRSRRRDEAQLRPAAAFASLVLLGVIRPTPLATQTQPRCGRLLLVGGSTPRPRGAAAGRHSDRVVRRAYGVEAIVGQAAFPSTGHHAGPDRQDLCGASLGEAERCTEMSVSRVWNAPQTFPGRHKRMFKGWERQEASGTVRAHQGDGFDDAFACLGGERRASPRRGKGAEDATDRQRAVPTLP